MSNQLSNIIRNATSSLYFNNIERKELNSTIMAFVEKTSSQNSLLKNRSFDIEPRPFQDVYIVPTLNDGNGNKFQVNDAISLLTSHKDITIIGNAGTGKSTFLKYLLHHAVAHSFKVPVLVEVRKLIKSEKTLNDYIQLELMGLEQTNNELFNSNNWLFMFDGYDEIYDNNDSTTIQKVQDFIYKYHQNNFVITSRMGTNVEILPNFYSFKISPLTTKDKSALISNFNLSEASKKHIIDTLATNKDYQDFIFSPLMMSVYAKFLDDQKKLNTPAKKSNLFSAIIDALITQHDATTKIGFKRLISSSLDAEQVRQLISEFAFVQFVKGEDRFFKDELYLQFNRLKQKHGLNFLNDDLIYDLSVSMNIIYFSKQGYTFSHKLIMEYLTAFFVCSLPTQSKVSFYETLTKNEVIKPTESLLTFLSEMDGLAFEEFYLLKVLNDFDDSKFIEQQNIHPEFTKFTNYLLSTVHNKTISDNDAVNIKSLHQHYQTTAHQSKFEVDRLLNLET